MKMYDRLLRILALSAVCVIVGCSDRSEIKAPGVDQADSTQVAKPRPDQQIRGAHIGLFDGPIKTTDIQAEYIEKFVKQDSTLAWGLVVHFYDANGKETSNLTADSGLVRESTKWMVANGNVVVVTEDSSRLETEQLFWYGDQEMIKTDSFVTVYQHGDTLRGYGLETDHGLKRVKIKRQVSGTLKSTEGITE
jgi:LPS export ABC transporter protein LptC